MVCLRQVSVPGLSSNKSLNTITVDGTPVAVDGSVNKIHGITSVSVVADPTDDYATYAVTGATDLKTGSNTVTVAVTAEDGSKASYSFIRLWWLGLLRLVLSRFL